VSGRLGGLVRGTLIYGVGQALSRSMTLLLIPVLTAYLDPAAYGVLAVLTAFGLLLNTVFSVGLGAATAPCYFEAGQKGATIWTALAILSVSCAVMLAVVAGFAPAIARLMLGDAGYGRLTMLAAGATALAILSVPLRQYLMFEERPVLSVCFSLISLIVSLALTVWFVAGLGRGVQGVLEADLIAQGATCAVFALPVVRSFPVEIRRRLARELLALGVPLIPAFGSVFVLQHGSRYILQWLQGPEQVGVYAVGVNLAGAIGLLVAGFQSAWMPYFMRFADRRDEAGHAFGRVATYYTVAVGTATLLMYLFARPLVALLAAPEYRGAERVVGLAATSQFLSGSFLILIPGLYFAREVKYVGAMQAAAAAVAVVLNVALVPAMGYTGSALAVTVSYVLLNAGQLWWNSRRPYVEAHFDWLRLRRFGTLYTVFALLTWIPRDLPLVLECGLAVLLAGLLGAMVWRLLTREERWIVWNMVAHRGMAVAPEARA
jgi:O-antigen/teichoic acid export membrane protein